MSCRAIHFPPGIIDFLTQLTPLLRAHVTAAAICRRLKTPRRRQTISLAIAQLVTQLLTLMTMLLPLFTRRNHASLLTTAPTPIGKSSASRQGKNKQHCAHRNHFSFPQAHASVFPCNEQA